MRPGDDQARIQGRFAAGISYSPATQFKPGQHAHNKLQVGAETVEPVTPATEE